MHVIDDFNADQFTTEEGYGLIPRDYGKIPLGEMPYTSPFAVSFAIIPETQWESRIQAMEGKQIRHLYTGTPAEDFQNGLSYCWAFSLSQAAKASRDADDQPHVDLLAESLGGSVGFRNRGNSCGDAIQWASAHGFCDRSYSPKRYGLDTRAWKTGWEDEAKNHRVTEWWELGHVDMLSETITALLLGFSVYVGLNWASHAMNFQEVQWVDGKPAIWTPNTWNAGQDWLLKGSKMVPDEAYCIRGTTWSKS